MVTDILLQSLPNYVPFIDGDKRISFTQFQNDIKSYCFALQKIESSSAILYIPDNIYLFYVCFMALLYADKDIILPGYLTDSMIPDVLKLSPVLITDEKFSNASKDLIDPTTIITNETADLKPIQNGYISFFTSGSTNAPKIITKTFESLMLEIQIHSEMQQSVIKKSPIVLATVMPNHMYGMLWRFLFPLYNQLTQDLDTIFYPEEIQAKQKLYHYISLITTPTFMNEIVAYDSQYHFSKNCLAIYSSGSLLSQATSEKMYHLFNVSPFEIFGSTETGGVAYRQQISSQEFCVFPTVKIEQNVDKTIKINSSFSYKSPYDMQDLIEPTSNNTFKLLGRNDRIVKIAENKVSLSEMESKLSQNSLVKESYCLSIPKGNNMVLGALICLNGQGNSLLKKNGKLYLVQALKKYLSAWYSKNVLPKKIRFVYQIPKNTQGKILKKEIESIIHSPCSEPIIENLIYEKNKLQADLTFLKDNIYFKGHFPDFPILPGVIQLHTIFYFLEHFFHETPQNYSIQKLKFTNLILPDTTIQFQLEKVEQDKYNFHLNHENKPCASGIVAIGGKDV